MKPADAEEYTQALGQVVAGGWRQIALGQRLGVPKALGLPVDRWVKQRLGGYVKYSVNERDEAIRTLAVEGFTAAEIKNAVGTGRRQVRKALKGTAGTKRQQKIAANKALKGTAGTNPLDVMTSLAATTEIQQSANATVVRESKRTEYIAKLEDEATKHAKALLGVYDVVVVDPPWPMEKIERDVREQQSEFEYTTLNEAELAALHIPTADDAHVWLWTTQRFLPMAFRLLDAWKLTYICTFVWHKPGGFQPFGLPQFNCEFALYARKGAPKLLDAKAAPVCFRAPRGKHSEKPDEFYDFVRRVTAGRRIDMFNRRPIDGFDGWGKEAA
jgi:N6-adenosine-specific RNA methylase IME4